MAVDELQNKASSEEPEGEKKDAAQEVKNSLDDLRPRFEAREWLFTDGVVERLYVQRPLSYFGKMEFFALLGSALDQAMNSDGGINLNALLSQTDLSDMDSMMAAVAKVAIYVPDLMQNSYCIWLGVPQGERAWAKQVMAAPVTLDENNEPTPSSGLSDEEGIEIIEVFLDQNAEALKSFFASSMPTLWKRLRSRFGLKDASVSLKPSKPIRRRTRSQ